MASAIAGGTSTQGGSTNAFGFGSSSSSASDAKPISTMMIKKKRKPEDEAEGDDAAKKLKAANGDAKPSENGAESNGKAENGVNGHSSPEKMDTDKVKSDASTEELKK